MANMMQMMAKAQKFKSKMEELQTRVADTVVDGGAGGGLVTCQVQGRNVVSLKVDAALVRPDEKDVMEDMIVAALNNALGNADKLMQDETQKLMSDLGLPPGLGLPF